MRSGGGLAAGVALALTEKFPRVAVYVAEPKDFDDYGSGRCRQESRSGTKKARGLDLLDALLRALARCDQLRDEPVPPLCQGLVARADPETLVAVGFAFDELRLVVEPGGRRRSGGPPRRTWLEVKGRTVVIVLSGGNVGDDILADGVRAYRASESSAAVTGRSAAMASRPASE